MELQISEKQECLGKVYIDARFDIIENSFMSSPLDIVLLVEFLTTYGIVLKSTYGQEISWKSKKDHCHWRCQLEMQEGKKSLPKVWSQALKYFLGKKNIDIQKFYIKLIKPKNDLETFFQYPLKDIEEYENIEADCQYGFTETELRELWIRARENRRIALDIFEKHEQKKNNEILEYDKLKSYIDSHRNDCIITAYHSEKAARLQNIIDNNESEQISQGYKLSSFRSLQYHIGTLIIQYYMEEHDGKTPYGNKIVSLFNRYCLNTKILFPEDLASIIFKL